MASTASEEVGGATAIFTANSMNHVGNTCHISSMFSPQVEVVSTRGQPTPAAPISSVSHSLAHTRLRRRKRTRGESDESMSLARHGGARSLRPQTARPSHSPAVREGRHPTKNGFPF